MKRSASDNKYPKGAALADAKPDPVPFYTL